MRSIIIALFILILLTTIFTSQVYSDWTVNPTSINFGEVPLGSSRTVTLSITNTNPAGGAAINFNFSASTTDITITPVGVLPLPAGQTLGLAVTFRPSTRGNYSGWIQITSNDPNTPSFTIPFTATSSYTSALSATPTSISLGDVPIGSSKNLYLTISNIGTSVAENIRISSSNPAVTVSVSSIPNLSPGQSRTIEIIFRPTAKGSYFGEISILYDSPTQQYLSVPFTGSSSYAIGIEVSTNSINFGIVNPGESKEEILRVRNSGRNDINITISLTKGVPFRVLIIDEAGRRREIEGMPFVLRPGQMETLIVTFTPTQRGFYNGLLSVVSDDRNTPIVSVSLKGDTETGLGLAFVPEVLNFGYVFTNTSSEKFIKLSNISNEPVQVSLSLQNQSGNAFVLHPSEQINFMLGPGEMRRINIIFTPVDKISYSASLVVSTRGNSSTLTVFGVGSGNVVEGLEPQNPPPSSGGGGGGGCSVAGKIDNANFGNALVMFAPAMAIVLRRFLRKLIK